MMALPRRRSSDARPLRWALRGAALAACVGAAGLAPPARAGENHADASATTKAAACTLALRLARIDVPNSRVTNSHCECLEDRDVPDAPWSCTAFVSYR
ncbi:MAG: hypothetical protein ABSG83_10545 [Roseiarcus sp.]|jgi:hypothetical protein